MKYLQLLLVVCSLLHYKPSSTQQQLTPESGQTLPTEGQTLMGEGTTDSIGKASKDNGKDGQPTPAPTTATASTDEDHSRKQTEILRIRASPTVSVNEGKSTSVPSTGTASTAKVNEGQSTTVPIVGTNYTAKVNEGQPTPAPIIGTASTVEDHGRKYKVTYRIRAAPTVSVNEGQQTPVPSTDTASTDKKNYNQSTLAPSSRAGAPQDDDDGPSPSVSPATKKVTNDGPSTLSLPNDSKGKYGKKYVHDDSDDFYRAYIKKERENYGFTDHKDTMTEPQEDSDYDNESNDYVSNEYGRHGKPFYKRVDKTLDPDYNGHVNNVNKRPVQITGDSSPGRYWEPLFQRNNVPAVVKQDISDFLNALRAYLDQSLLSLKLKRFGRIILPGVKSRLRGAGVVVAPQRGWLSTTSSMTFGRPVIFKKAISSPVKTVKVSVIVTIPKPKLGFDFHILPRSCPHYRSVGLALGQEHKMKFTFWVTEDGSKCYKSPLKLDPLKSTMMFRNLPDRFHRKVPMQCAAVTHVRKPAVSRLLKAANDEVFLPELHKAILNRLLRPSYLKALHRTGGRICKTLIQSAYNPRIGRR